MKINFDKVINLDTQRLKNLKDLVADRRFKEETKGVTLNGSAFETSRDSQNLITGAAMSALIDSNYVCKWKTKEGFVEYTSTEIIAIAQAIRSHVQSCFNREAEISEHIDNGTFTDQMIEEGWPNGVYNNA